VLDRSVCIACGTAKWGFRYESLYSGGAAPKAWSCPAQTDHPVAIYTETSDHPEGCTHLLEQGVAASLRGDRERA
jgi:hypothetical protein